MMRQIKHYLSIYYEFFRTNIGRATAFRVNFLLLVVMDLAFYVSTLLSVSFIYDHIDTIGPWSRAEFLFFIAFLLTIEHAHITFISENFWEFSDLIKFGNLDFVLIKPAGAIFSVFCRHIRVATLGNFIVPWSVLIYWGIENNLSLLSWILVPLLVLMALALLFAIEMALAMSMFWVVEGWGINVFRIQLQAVSRWPDYVYLNYLRRLFTIFIPVLLVGSAPVKFLLDNSLWYLPAVMLCAIGVLTLLIRILWKAGLRQYSSASS